MRIRSFVLAFLSSCFLSIGSAFAVASESIRDFAFCLPALVGADALAIDSVGHAADLNVAPRVDNQHRSFLSRALSHARFFGDGFKLDSLASPA